MCRLRTVLAKCVEPGSVVHADDETVRTESEKRRLNVHCYRHRQLLVATNENSMQRRTWTKQRAQYLKQPYSPNAESHVHVWADFDLMALDRLLDVFAQRFLCFSSISFCFSYTYVRQTKLASSVVNFRVHGKNSACLIDWFTLESDTGKSFAYILPKIH